ncbi:MAG: hypothetical protein ACM3XS_00150 [Bacteroidota bacterium]
MDIRALATGNLLILGSMLIFALLWNLLTWVGRHRRLGETAHVYRADGKAWRGYYWRGVRRYLLTYAVVLTVLLLLPVILRRGGATTVQFQGLLMILPGLAGYFLLISLAPARVALHAHGLHVFALIPFLPGQRDRQNRTFSDFRVGVRFWREFHDAVPRGSVLILRGDLGGLEIPIPKGRRDLLLGIAREGLKRAKDARRQRKRREAGA